MYRVGTYNNQCPMERETQNFCLTNELDTLQFSEKLSIIQFTIMGFHLNNRYVCIPEKHSLESSKHNNLKIWYLRTYKNSKNSKFD